MTRNTNIDADFCSRLGKNSFLRKGFHSKSAKNNLESGLTLDAIRIVFKNCE